MKNFYCIEEFFSHLNALKTKYFTLNFQFNKCSNLFIFIMYFTLVPSP